ncbi:MAG: immunoglobulin domain-containing protein [Phycisphaerae bacterium]|nr:immunoglobulin domain-containing protein [Phycisphaerae bacterium]
MSPIVESVEQIVARDRATPRPPRPIIRDEREYPDRRGLPQAPGAEFVPMWPWDPVAPRPAQIANTWLDAPQSIGLNVVGITQAESFSFPPDSQGAVGLTQLIVLTNGRIKVLAKSNGAVGPLNVTLDAFFASVRGNATCGDPQVRFDRISQRWFVSAITFTEPNRIMIAVSSGATITAQANFSFYFFVQDQVTPAGNTGLLADYASLGVDNNALYIGADMFNGGFVNTSAWVVRKSSVLSGGPIVANAFRNLIVAGNGPTSPRGVDNDDSAATEGYFIGADSGTFGRLVLRRVSSPGTSPTMSSNINLTVPATSFPVDVVAQGSADPLDALDDRLFAAQIRRNRATGVRSLWTAHNIQVNTSGVAVTSGGKNGSRWYQVSNLTGTPSLTQSGTLFDATGARHIWIPSVAASGQGHMAIAASSAGAAQFASVVAAGRLSTDALGTTQAPATIVAGAAAYNQEPGMQRWGDYSATVVDPADDQTLWTFQEYAASGGQWAVRATRLIAPPPATPASCNPSSVMQGQSNVNVTLTGTSAGGSGFYDTDASFPSRLQALVGGTGVTVNSVLFTNPTQIVLNVTATGAAALGARTISVTNPDGQSASSATGILTIAPGNPCPQFTGQPTGGTICVGAGVQFQVSAVGSPTPTFQWRRNGVNIAGATSPTYTITNATVGASGTYTCVATNSCGSATSDPAVLVVEPGPTITTQPQSLVVQSGAAATFTVATSSAGVSYQWRLDGSLLPGANQPLYAIPAVGPQHEGNYSCLLINACGQTISAAANLSIGNVCYANCDRSTVPPVLNILDYVCFIDAFAMGKPYANCDGSTAAPVFNVADFTCFTNRFNAGCP